MQRPIQISGPDSPNTYARAQAAPQIIPQAVPQSAPSIRARVNYHVHQARKQAFVFDADDMAGNLLSPPLVEVPISVTDVRGSAQQLDFDTSGICFVPFADTPALTDSGDWTAAYNRALGQLLTDHIGAEDVWVFDHTIRSDTDSANRRPARNVHVDYSAASAKRRLNDILGTTLGADAVDDVRAGHYGFVNVWRPLDHSVRTSPLGFIRADTVQPDDWMTIDLVYPDRRGEILGLEANPAHDWFFQSDMTPNEAVIFNIYDSRGRPHLAHSALDLVDTPPVQTPGTKENRP